MHGARAPTSMPVPSVPRKAAPPRRKAKSSSLPLDSSQDTSDIVSQPSKDQPEVSDDVHADRVKGGEGLQEPETEEPQPEASDIPQTEVDLSPKERSDTAGEPPKSRSPEVTLISEEVITIPATSIVQTLQDDEKIGEELLHDVAYDTAESVSEQPPHEEIPASFPTTETPVAEAIPEQEEEDEVARRQRVAERLAKMGAFNPFAPPPQRQASTSSSLVDANVTSEELDDSVIPSLPPDLPKRASVRKSTALTATSSDVPLPDIELSSSPVEAPATVATISVEIQPSSEKDGAESEGSDYGGEGSEDGKY